MKKLLYLIFGLPVLLFSQSLDDLEFGTEETFDIVTWNIEFFPKNDQTTIQYVASIVEAMDADLIAIQEISDYFAWNELVAYLNDYSGYRQSINNRGLGFLYKADVVQINDGFELFTQDPEANNFPRYPMVLDLVYAGERFVVINNHYKCCGNGDLDPTDPWDEETRRLNANLLLKEYIDAELEDVKVILLGDLNDILTDPIGDNVFSAFLDDTDNYLFTDIGIANGSSENWSFPNWPSHLDHILITNELFDLFTSEGASIETLRIEDYLQNGWDEYDQNVSDHRPVGLKLPLDQTLGNQEMVGVSALINTPNPIKGSTTFMLSDYSVDIIKIYIYNIQGQLLFSKEFAAGKKEITIDLSNIAAGVHIAQLEIAGVVDTVKIVKL